MEENRWEDYIGEILTFVKFKYDHKAIRRELFAHMEDLCGELQAEGLDENMAHYMTVEYMGEAAEIGRELDQEHHALLGWLWRISRIVAVVLLLVSALPLLDVGIYLAGSFVGQEFSPAPGNGELWHMEVDREFHTYDDTVILQDILYYPDGTLDIRYGTKRSLFSKSRFGTGMLGHGLYDEKGEELHHNAGGRKNGGYISKGQLQIREVTAEAKWLVLSYGSELKIVVDLETGEVTEK